MPEPVKMIVEEPGKLPDPLKANVPALIVVAPVYVLAPLKVNVPVPFLVSPPAPEMAPAKTFVVFSPPVVSVFDPSMTEEVPELLFNEPIVCPDVNAEILKMPEPVRTTGERVYKAPELFSANVPALIVVAPV